MKVDASTVAAVVLAATAGGALATAVLAPRAQEAARTELTASTADDAQREAVARMRGARGLGAAATGDGPAVTLIESGELRLTPTGAAGSWRITQPMRNDGASTMVVWRAHVYLRSAGGDSLHAPKATLLFDGKEAPAGVALPPHRVTPVVLAFTQRPDSAVLAGSLVYELSADSNKATAVTRVLRIMPWREPRDGERATVIVLGMLLVSAVMAGITTPPKPIASSPAPKATTWESGSSWATNIGIAGGLVTALTAATVLSDQPHHLAREAYLLLNGIFIALIALAPPAYRFTRNWPRLAMFLMATLTAWGALGQCALAHALIDEVERGGLLPSEVTLVLQGTVLLLAVLLLAYVGVSVKDGVERSTVSGAKAAAGAPDKVRLL